MCGSQVVRKIAVNNSNRRSRHRSIDDAFTWMDRAVDGGDQMMMPIKTYPFLDPIRADPRFLALLRKVNLDS